MSPNCGPVTFLVISFLVRLSLGQNSMIKGLSLEDQTSSGSASQFANEEGPSISASLVVPSILTWEDSKGAVEPTNALDSSEGMSGEDDILTGRSLTTIQHGAKGVTIYVDPDKKATQQSSSEYSESTEHIITLYLDANGNIQKGSDESNEDSSENTVTIILDSFKPKKPRRKKQKLSTPPPITYDDHGEVRGMPGTTQAPKKGFFREIGEKVKDKLVKKTEPVKPLDVIGEGLG